MKGAVNFGVLLVLVALVAVVCLAAVATAEDNADSNQERINSIAFNSREVRIVNGRPVEMKDDFGTRVLVVFDNIQKDASFVVDQVRKKISSL